MVVGASNEGNISDGVGESVANLVLGEMGENGALARIVLGVIVWLHGHMQHDFVAIAVEILRIGLAVGEKRNNRKSDGVFQVQHRREFANIVLANIVEDDGDGGLSIFMGDMFSHRFHHGLRDWFGPFWGFLWGRSGGHRRGLALFFGTTGPGFRRDENQAEQGSVFQIDVNQGNQFALSGDLFRGPGALIVFHHSAEPLQDGLFFLFAGQLDLPALDAVFVFFGDLALAVEILTGGN